MTQRKDIRKQYFEEGRTVAEISRLTGHDRKTVSKYIEQEDWNETVPDVTQRDLYPKLEPFKREIDQWLLDDRRARRKQRHTAQRVYDRLVELHGKDFTCSYRTVAGYVASRKREIYSKTKSASLPLEHIPGEAQVDFGESDFYLDGELCTGHHLNLSFPYSNQGYAQLYRGENQQCLFEGLIAIFNHIGGVPIRIWFDNPSTIVSKVLKDGGRELTDSFVRFTEHYGFEAAFCNTAAGHEKGNVEGKVGYHRRNLLVPVPRITDLTAFNKSLLEKCDRDGLREHYRKDATISQLSEADMNALRPLPAVALDVAKYSSVRTNGYGRFYLSGGLHEYSVSPKYANSRILVRISAHEVVPLDDSHREIVRHRRLYGETKQSSMLWEPYLDLLSRNPGALKYSGIYGILPDSLQEFLERCGKSERGTVLRAIASLTKASSLESAIKTVDVALTYDAFDTESLVNLHRRIHSPEVELPPLSLSGRVPRLDSLSTSLAAYDAALTGTGEDLC